VRPVNSCSDLFGPESYGPYTVAATACLEELSYLPEYKAFLETKFNPESLFNAPACKHVGGVRLLPLLVAD
jgi:hypothetical protein